MTYFPDLTPHSYTMRFEEKGVLNVGWLGEGQPFKTGSTSVDFRNALKTLCENPIHLHRGCHQCEYCPPQSSNNWTKIGNGQIRIRGEDGLWYVAPTMIYHYVYEHNYHPPDEFINAVLNPKEIADDLSGWR
ncbi:hypothetical protein ACL6C3_25220 [Capilliphycus salinus ALCB114379]|uniref:DUF7919 family protein n=1 Tax=Capilliphycus salinus TaxID=2768948 RepID=UPI0039A5B787